VDKPATIALPAGAAGTGRLVLAVTGFTPSAQGPVQAVVKLRCGAGEREIGRFAITPQVAFTASVEEAQRFGLALPPDQACGQAASLSVHLVPSRGDGRGASIEIGGVERE
jgi:hypothetical protein